MDKKLVTTCLLIIAMLACGSIVFADNDSGGAFGGFHKGQKEAPEGTEWFFSPKFEGELPEWFADELPEILPHLGRVPGLRSWAFPFNPEETEGMTPEEVQEYIETKMLIQAAQRCGIEYEGKSNAEIRAALEELGLFLHFSNKRDESELPQEREGKKWPPMSFHQLPDLELWEGTLKFPFWFEDNEDENPEDRGPGMFRGSRNHFSEGFFDDLKEWLPEEFPQDFFANLPSPGIPFGQKGNGGKPTTPDLTDPSTYSSPKQLPPLKTN